MEINSNSPITNTTQIKPVPSQKTEVETTKSNTVDTVTISAEAQSLSDEITPNRGGGDVIIKKPTQ